MSNRELDLTANIIDVRDMTDRLDELIEIDDAGHSNKELDELAKNLQDLLSELAGYGGDHQYNGDRYPSVLIRDRYFAEYAQELAEDIGVVNLDGVWPSYCIDWEWAARDLKMDYSGVEVDGATYWYR